MMIGGHLLVATGGFFVYKESVTAGGWSIAETYIELVLIWCGCLLPDIDCRESTVGKRIPILSYPISLVLGHRGALHSLLAVAGLGYLAYEFQLLWLEYVAMGYLLHLIGDYLTPSGVPLLFPFDKRFRFALVADTNSVGEWVFAGGIFVGCLLYVFW